MVGYGIVQRAGLGALVFWVLPALTFGQWKAGFAKVAITPTSPIPIPTSNSSRRWPAIVTMSDRSNCSVPIASRIRSSVGPNFQNDHRAQARPRIASRAAEARHAAPQAPRLPEGQRPVSRPGSRRQARPASLTEATVSGPLSGPDSFSPLVGPSNNIGPIQQ